jgi:cytochrome c oxidase subunit 2
MATSTAVIDGAMIYILAFSALLFFLIVFFMVYFAVRYRKTRNPVPSEIPDSPLLEAVWIIIPTLLVLSMFVYGLTGFRFFRGAPEGALKIKVHSRQWSWIFEYPNGKKSPDMVVPAGRNVVCELTSADVIHGFYIPAFRLQQNTVPGLTTRVWFNAVKPGATYILCSMYCGQKHATMLAKLIVVPPEQYEEWVNGGAVSYKADPESLKMPAGERLLFERGCISCHSLEGTKMAGPSFQGLFGSRVTVSAAGKQKELTVNEDYIFRSIVDPKDEVTDGFPNIMPSGRDILSDSEIAEIIVYLKSLKPSSPNKDIQPH